MTSLQVSRSNSIGNDLEASAESETLTIFQLTLERTGDLIDTFLPV